jgi:hypothetical protein
MEYYEVTLYSEKQGSDVLILVRNSNNNTLDVIIRI